MINKLELEFKIDLSNIEIDLKSNDINDINSLNDKIQEFTDKIKNN